MTYLKFALGLMVMTFTLSHAFATEVTTPPLTKPDAQLVAGEKALRSLTGCYLVDYSYSETESLKPGYTMDPRVYDVNRNQSVKEWIYLDKISETKFRLQHTLFAVGLDGQVIDGSQLKHTGEDWEYNAPFMYDFVSPARWEVVKLPADGRWTRRITHLDDGLRYQCSAPWDITKAYPEFSCQSYAPIPGRETRDMQRKDYNTLQRTTRVIAYGNSWLERQDNIKTIDASGVRTPLARETGKNWYVRLPDLECAEAQAFVAPRKIFWDILRDTWNNDVLIGDRPFVEIQPATTRVPRYVEMWDIETTFLARDLNQPAVRSDARDAIMKVIQNYRGN